jgi:hypothetical protein
MKDTYTGTLRVYLSLQIVLEMNVVSQQFVDCHAHDYDFYDHQKKQPNKSIAKQQNEFIPLDHEAITLRFQLTNFQI